MGVLCKFMVHYLKSYLPSLNKQTIFRYPKLGTSHLILKTKVFLINKWGYPDFAGSDTLALFCKCRCICISKQLIKSYLILLQLQIQQTSLKIILCADIYFGGIFNGRWVSSQWKMSFKCQTVCPYLVSVSPFIYLVSNNVFTRICTQHLTDRNSYKYTLTARGKRYICWSILIASCIAMGHNWLCA